MNIHFDAVSELDGYLTIDLQPEDYQEIFNKQLRKHAKQADIKGFRKGMVPPGIIKKMYGKSILIDELFGIASRKTQEYAEEQKLNLIARPILEDNDLKDINPNILKEHTLKFHIGYYKDFIIDILESGKTFPLYNIKVDDEAMNTELERIRNENGDRVELKEVEELKADDILDFDVLEISESGEAVENPIQENARLLFEFFKDEDTIKKLKNIQPGETIDSINFPKAVEKSKEELLKNLFKSDKKAEEVSDFFKITINKIERLNPAELNKEMFDKMFPEENIETEDDFRNKIKEEIAKAYTNQTREIRKNFLQLELIKNTSLQLPEEFIRKYVESVKKEEMQEKQDFKVEDAKVGDEELKNEIKGIKWELIKSKIVKENELKIEMEDVKRIMKENLLKSMNLPPMYMDTPFMDEWAEKSLKDKKLVEETASEAMFRKVLDFVSEKVEEDEKEVTLAEFQDIYKKLNDEY